MRPTQRFLLEISFFSFVAMLLALIVSDALQPLPQRIWGPTLSVHQPAPCHTLEQMRDEVEAAAYFENGVSLSDKNLAILVEEYCRLMSTRDAIIREYLTDFAVDIRVYQQEIARVQAVFESIGYRHESLRGAPPTLEQTMHFVLVLAQIQEILPLGLVWVRCDVPEEAGLECWSVPETTHGELKIIAEIYGDFSFLRVESMDFSFVRSCPRLTFEQAHELWSCPITVIYHHPGGTDDHLVCQNMRAVWSEAGAVRYWYATEGPYCGPLYEPPPVEPPIQPPTQPSMHA